MLYHTHSYAITHTHTYTHTHTHTHTPAVCFRSLIITLSFVFCVFLSRFSQQQFGSTFFPHHITISFVFLKIKFQFLHFLSGMEGKNFLSVSVRMRRLTVFALLLCISSSLWTFGVYAHPPVTFKAAPVNSSVCQTTHPHQHTTHTSHTQHTLPHTTHTPTHNTSTHNTYTFTHPPTHPPTPHT